MAIVQAICPVGDHAFEYEPKPGQQRIYCSDAHQILALGRRQTAKKALLSTRRCCRCKQQKPASEFPGPSGGYCRPCAAEYARERRKTYGRRGADYMWLVHLRRYGLTAETFAELVSAQGGRCAICGTSEPGGQGRWHVDHDHLCCGVRKSSCGHCIRGLLCSRCNIGIGNLRDDPEVIQAALNYITAYRARRSALQ